MKHEIVIKDLEDLGRAAQAFLEAIGEHTLVAFYAPMGAGKTTFTTAVCKALGVEEDAISSPHLRHRQRIPREGGKAHLPL